MPRCSGVNIFTTIRKNEMQINTDPELFFSILENLLLNAFEAQGKGAMPYEINQSRPIYDES